MTKFAETRSGPLFSRRSISGSARRIGVEVSAGERQQRCDGQAFLTRNSQVGGVIRYVLTHWRLTFRRFRAVG
jgi:hypothetical protein